MLLVGLLATRAALLSAGGVVTPEATTDHEEKEQCVKMQDIITQYKLDGEFRCAELHIIRRPVLMSAVLRVCTQKHGKHCAQSNRKEKKSLHLSALF